MEYGLTKGREDGSAPHEFPENARDKDEASHFGAESVLEGVQHGDVLAFTELLGEKDAAKEETQCVSKWGLTPNESF